MEKELRRRQSILSITGIGVMFFGLWNFIKLHLYFLLAKDTIIAGYDPSAGLSDRYVFRIAYVLCLILALISLGIRFRIGRSAIRESRGIPFRPYFGLCIFLILLHAGTIVFEVLSLRVENTNVFDLIASLIVDITSLSMLIELTLSAIKLRKLKKAPKEGAES